MTIIPTDREKRIITELVEQGRSLVPGMMVRFIEHVEQPGQKEGIVIGIQLPPDLPAKSMEAFLLHDLFKKYGREQCLPIGLVLKELANIKGATDLSFLPANVIAPSQAISARPGAFAVPRPLAISIAVIVVLLLAALVLQKQQSGQEVKELAAARPTTTHGQGASSLPPQFRNRVPQNQAQNRPYPEAAPFTHKPLPHTNFPWLPPVGIQPNPSQTIVTRTPYQLDEWTARRQVFNDLSQYRNVLRLRGRLMEAEQVERIMRAIP